MASYTISIREILQQNKTPEQHLDDISDVQDLAMAYIFDKAPINVLDSDYRSRFVTGFTLHFMNEEIGLETIPLWKIALNEKLYNNAEYINQIFNHLDNQIFADYTVKHSTTTGEHSNEKRGTGTVENIRDDDTTTTTSDTFTKSETVTNTKDGTVEATGTITNAKTGTDTLSRTGTDATAKTGSDTHAKTGTDTTSKTGSDTHAKTGTDTIGHSGTDETAHTGTQGVASTNSQETANTGTTSTDNNSVQIVYDTPMGTLANMRTPGGDAKGTGVSYVNGQTYNYMSGSQEDDASSVVTDNTTQNIDGSEDSTTTFNDTVTVTKDLTDETTYASTNTDTYNSESAVDYDSTDTDTYNSTDTKTLNLSDETAYGSTDTETRNTVDTTNITDETETSGTDSKSGSIAVQGTIQDTQTRDITDTDMGSHNETVQQTDYNINMEMLYRSMPLLNKVWEVFDDIFMLIY